MIITREEFNKLIESAVIGTDSLSTDAEEQVIAIVNKIERYISDCEKINQAKAERISIDVCAN